MIGERDRDDHAHRSRRNGAGAGAKPHVPAAERRVRPDPDSRQGLPRRVRERRANTGGVRAVVPEPAAERGLVTGGARRKLDRLAADARLRARWRPSSCRRRSSSYPCPPAPSRSPRTSRRQSPCRRPLRTDPRRSSSAAPLHSRPVAVRPLPDFGTRVEDEVLAAEGAAGGACRRTGRHERQGRQYGRDGKQRRGPIALPSPVRRGRTWCDPSLPPWSVGGDQSCPARDRAHSCRGAHRSRIAVGRDPPSKPLQ